MKRHDWIAVTTHGCTKHPMYNRWYTMKRRCADKTHHQYKNYGARGIRLCKRWLDVLNFIEDMGFPPKGDYTLDRIDNSKGYSKKNCRWATRKQQLRNTRINVMLKYKGETKCMADWAEIYKLPYYVVWNRINRSFWSVEKTLNTVNDRLTRYK